MSAAVDGYSTRGDRRPSKPTDHDLVRKPLERLRDRLLYLTARMPDLVAADYMDEVDQALKALKRLRSQALHLDPNPPPLNLEGVEEGDLIEVRFRDHCSTHRVRNVIYGYNFDVENGPQYTHVTINLDPVESLS